MKLSPAERETIILFSDADDTASVYTYDRRLIKKLEAGDRNIYHEYVAFCHYKGKRHAMLLKRRKAEFALLYVP